MPTTQTEKDALYQQLLLQKSKVVAPDVANSDRARIVADSIAKNVKDKSLAGDFGAQAKRFGRAADDVMRTLAGGLGDTVAGTLTPGSSVMEEAIKTQASKARLNTAAPYLGTGLEVAGTIGKVAALPGTVVATPMRAMATTGVLSLGDTFIHKLQNGEPVNTDVEEYLLAGTVGAGLGLAGFHLGKLLGNLISPYVGKNPSITSAAKDALKANKALTDDGVSLMQQSGVSINKVGLARLLRVTENRIGQNIELSPDVTKEAWKAMRILRARVGKGQDITLENFDALKRVMGNALYSESGLLKRDVTSNDLKALQIIYESMDEFVTKLPSLPHFFRGGDPKIAAQGWQKMQEFRIKVARTERVAELLANAEAKAARGKKAFEQAVYDEFKMFTELPAGRAILAREFTKEQAEIIEKMAKGDLSAKNFEILDRLFGSTLLSPLFRTLRSIHGSAFEAEETRHLSRKAIDIVAEQAKVAQKAAVSKSKLGIASVVAAEDQAFKQEK